MTETRKEVVHPKTSLVYTKDAPVVEKELWRDYNVQNFERNEATTFEHVTAICEAIAQLESTKNNPVNSEVVLTRLFNNSLDLKVRGVLAPRLEALVEGPRKTIEKAAKANAALFGMSLDDARAEVIAQMKSKGIPTE